LGEGGVENYGKKELGPPPASASSAAQDNGMDPPQKWDLGYNLVPEINFWNTHSVNTVIQKKSVSTCGFHFNHNLVHPKEFRLKLRPPLTDHLLENQQWLINLLSPVLC